MFPASLAKNILIYSSANRMFYFPIQVYKFVLTTSFSEQITPFRSQWNGIENIETIAGCCCLSLVACRS